MENQKKQFSVMDDEKFIEFLTHQFNGVHERFDKMNEKLDFSIDSSKKRFDEICERLNIVEKKIESMGRVTKLEKLAFTK